MNKEEIIKILKRYNFDTNKYIVISGAAMVLQEIKEQTSDIDIAVEEDYSDYLLNNYDCIFERVNEYGINCYMIDNVINFSETYYDSNYKVIENIKVQDANDILKLKQKLKREKDISDIKLLNSYISRNNI